MSNDEIRLEALSYPEVEQLDRGRSVVLIPTGSIEQHGPHLPLDTDAFLATEVAFAAARHARSVGPVLVTPTVSYGLSEHHMAFPGTLTLQPTTFASQVENICASLIRHGFNRLLIVNGHGGNSASLAVLIQQLGFDWDGWFAFLNYWDAARDVVEQVRDSPQGGMGHSGEFETSLMMHLRPDQVRTEHIQRGIVQPLYDSHSLDLLIKGPLTAHWKTHELSNSGVMGAPDLANAEKGSHLFDACVEGIAEIIEELRQA